MCIYQKHRQENLLMSSFERSDGKLIQEKFGIQRGQDQLKERILLLQNGLLIQKMVIMVMQIMPYL